MLIVQDFVCPLGNLHLCIWNPIVHRDQWQDKSNEVGFVDGAQGGSYCCIWLHIVHVPFEMEREATRWMFLSRQFYYVQQLKSLHLGMLCLWFCSEAGILQVHHHHVLHKCIRFFSLCSEWKWIWVLVFTLRTSPGILIVCENLFL